MVKEEGTVKDGVTSGEDTKKTLVPVGLSERKHLSFSSPNYFMPDEEKALV